MGIKTLKRLLIFIVAIAWVFSGWSSTLAADSSDSARPVTSDFISPAPSISTPASTPSFSEADDLNSFADEVPTTTLEATPSVEFVVEASASSPSSSFLDRVLIDPIVSIIKYVVKGKRPSLFKDNFQAKEKIKIDLGNYREEELTVSLTAQSEKVLTEQKITDDFLEISRPRNFKPGKYHLNIKDKETEKTLLDQDFTWGVLAINTNKSIYLSSEALVKEGLPPETAKLAMAVLDEEGNMVCDAKLKLVIKNSQLKIDDELSTENGRIIANPECQVHDFTLRPDYEAEYQVAEAGIYEMELTAETENGRYTIIDSFEVRNEVPFDVERITATRIYPPRQYPVMFKIKVNQDFKGEIVEAVPQDFEIIAPDSEEAAEFRIEENDSQKEKLLIWPVDWKEGDFGQIEYYFKAPNISPQFYLLGPLNFRQTIQKIDNPQEILEGESAVVSNQIDPFTQTIDDPLLGASPSAAGKESSNVIITEEIIIFQEIRQWQIAADTPAGPNNPTNGVEDTTVGSVSWSGYTNVYANDNVNYATVTLTKGIISRYIKATGFNFSLANCNSIDGVYVEVDRKSNDAANMEDYSVRLVNGSGTIVGDNKAIAGNWPTADTYQNYGGSSDTWTAGLACGDVTNANFGVVFAAQNTVAAKPRDIIASVDHIRVTVYYTVQTDSWTGTVYTDDDEGTTIANGTSICAVVNNGTPACSTTTSGVFTINTLNAAAGDQLTFFIDGGSILGNTVTISNGGDIVGAGNLRIYQNHVLVRYEQGTAISILDMDAYDNDQNPDDMLFDAEDLAIDTLSVESNIELFVYNGYTFTPGGTVTTTGTGNLQIDDNAVFNGGTTLDHIIAGNLVIDTGATFNAPSTASDGTITLNGNFTNNGTFNAGSGKVIFAGADAGTQIITGSSTFCDFDASTNSNAAGRTLRFTGNSTQTVSGTWTITGYSSKVITLQSSDTNNWTINPTAASVTYVDVYRSTNTGVNFCATYSSKDVNTIGWNVSASGSCNQAPNNPTSLAQKKTDDTVLSVGDWTDETSVKFTATVSDPDSSDTLYLCVEKDLLGTGFSDTEDLCGTGVAYTGVGVTAAVTISSITDASEYHWQARVKDAANEYSSWVSYETNLETERDFGVDTTAPTGGTVYDGTETGVDKDFNDGSLSSLSANWSGFDAAVSGLNYYEYSIGTTAGGTDIKGWTNIGIGTSAAATSLTLQTSSLYYFNVRAVDNAGNIQTPVISSDGQLVAPSLTFGVAPASVSFANLNAGNNYNDTKTATLTTSTNAYNGYVIRAFVTDYLRSVDSNFTIADFDGGSYASPDEWLTGDRGFGYHSSDISIQGSDIFNNNPCPGGGTPPCYAPFSQSPPGDIVADHTDSVSGTPISGEEFTMTYQVKTNAIQEASTYSTVVVYGITAQY